MPGTYTPESTEYDGSELSRTETATPGQEDSLARVIELNVGGAHYSTTLDALVRFRHCILIDLLGTKDRDGRHFIDTDGALFGHILNFLRRDELPPPDVAEAVYREAGYFQIDELRAVLESIPPVLTKICRENTRASIPGYQRFLASLLDWVTMECKGNVSGVTTVYVALFVSSPKQSLKSSQTYDRNHICYGQDEASGSKVSADLHFGPWKSAVAGSEEDMMSFIVSDVAEKGFTVSDYGLVCDQCSYKCLVGTKWESCKKKLFHITIQWWPLPPNTTKVRPQSPSKSAKPMVKAKTVA